VQPAASREQWGRLRADVSRLVARRLPTRADVEDVVQEVLLRIWKHGPSLRNDERFGAWLSRVAYSATADHLRARQRHPLPRYEASDADGPADSSPPYLGPSGEEQNVKTMIAAVLHPFIAALAPPYRETMVLSELDGLPHAAIAEKLGVSISAVKSRVQRGRDLLRQSLERCCEIGLDARGTPVSCEVRPKNNACRGRTSRGGRVRGLPTDSSPRATGNHEPDGLGRHVDRAASCGGG
jgi:RNA polymerase sigma-70 factor (ECF subfamily)